MPGWASLEKRSTVCRKLKSALIVTIVFGVTDGDWFVIILRFFYFYWKEEEPDGGGLEFEVYIVGNTVMVPSFQKILRQVQHSRRAAERAGTVQELLQSLHKSEYMKVIVVLQQNLLFSRLQRKSLRFLMKLEYIFFLIQYSYCILIDE